MNGRSLEAWYGQDPRRLSIRERAIVDVVRQEMDAGRHGATTYEIEVATRLKHQSASSTVSKLWHTKHVLRPSGQTRKTDTGSRADVMEIGDSRQFGAPRQPAPFAPDAPKPRPPIQPPLGL
jgi:hypothetical protein